MSETIASRHKKKTKGQVRLTGRLERRVKDYSLAAAGVGALALASPAGAAVTTIAVNANVPFGGRYALNIPGVGKVLSIRNRSYAAGNFQADFVSEIGPVFAIPGGRSNIGPLTPGQIVPLSTVANYASLVNFVQSGGVVRYSWTGFLGNSKYLGFKFGSGANTHYGWLQLNISQNANHSYNVTLVQMAYETTANQPITVGATSPPPATPAPNSLWLLALGCAGLAGLETLRRRGKA
jgi:hypothetical protein